MDGQISENTKIIKTESRRYIRSQQVYNKKKMENKFKMCMMLNRKTLK